MENKDFLRPQMGQRAKKPKIEVEEITADLTASFKAVKLNLHWQVENVRKEVGILSGMMDCQRFPQTFQFGLRYVEDAAVVSLMIMNLHLLGLRVALVTLTCNNGKPVLMKRKTNERIKASKLDLFSHQFLPALNEVSDFYCQVLLEGVVDDYIHQQYDRLLNAQLWDSVLYSCWTDFKFFIGSNVFNAHKFVLSARSSRLEDDVSGVGSIRLADDLDPETFKCFLHFVYTGRLLMANFKATVLLDQLLSLAEKYEVETLKQLCLSDLKKLADRNFPHSFMSTEPAAIGPPLTDLDLEPKSKIFSKPDFTEIRFTWEINRLPQDYLVRAVNFNHQEAFHVCFRSGGASEKGKRNHALFFFGKQWPEGGIDVVTVNVVICEKSATDGITPRRKRLVTSNWPKVAGLNPAMTVFSVDLEESLLQAPFNIIFSIDLSSENSRQYSYQARDIRLAENLWSATFGALLTDTEIKVDGRIFRVHKALVAARSSVMRDLLNSQNVNETSLKCIVVKDVDPSTFEEVLYFMYTGYLRVSAADPKLLMAAEKYQIETLKILCENQVKGHDRSLQDLCSFLQLVA